MISETRGKRRKGELTPKQQAFVDAYLQTHSARKAAEIAGYADPVSQGWSLMRTASVADAITKGKEEMRRRNEHLEDQVLQELAKIAFSDISDVVTFDGTSMLVKRLEDIPEDVRPCIRKLTLTPGKYGDRVQIELHDKLKAQELLGKYMDLWSERVKVEGGDVPVQIEQTVTKLLVEDRIRMLRGEETYDDL